MMVGGKGLVFVGSQISYGSSILIMMFMKYKIMAKNMEYIFKKCFGDLSI